MHILYALPLPMRQLFAYICRRKAVPLAHEVRPTSRQSCETAVRFLIRLILIAKIFCAVVIARTSAVNGNRHCVAFLFRGFPRRFTPRNDIWGDCHNRIAVCAMTLPCHSGVGVPTDKFHQASNSRGIAV